MNDQRSRHISNVLRYLLAQEIQIKRRKEKLPWLSVRADYPWSNSLEEDDWSRIQELMRTMV
ncbi:hypothetical protein [Pseudomonas phage LUZ7]|uniref:Uncharacterized protein n=1 Tax=Pseudomonas phage LUZ7 TaxID=655097 RepID=C8ZKJ7_9CAUD|nr:hypothetical protein PP-LUZ7_gp098 [Pseudomonas phage LUZ7]CAZ66239.1 hypothetical protein [Pseudomonas phage LUZ7]